MRHHASKGFAVGLGKLHQFWQQWATFAGEALRVPSQLLVASHDLFGELVDRLVGQFQICIGHDVPDDEMAA